MAYAELIAIKSKEFKQETADLMIVITWNTDNTDIDLHVIEPSGEECYYSHNKTKSGGTLTRDVTTGYGPEMYLLPNAPDGKYKVRAKYYSSNRNRTSARTKIYVTVYEGWGTDHEVVTRKVVTLSEAKDMNDIIDVIIGDGKA